MTPNELQAVGQSLADNFQTEFENFIAANPDVTIDHINIDFHPETAKQSIRLACNTIIDTEASTRARIDVVGEVAAS